MPVHSALHTKARHDYLGARTLSERFDHECEEEKAEEDNVEFSKRKKMRRSLSCAGRGDFIALLVESAVEAPRIDRAAFDEWNHHRSSAKQLVPANHLLRTVRGHSVGRPRQENDLQAGSLPFTAFSIRMAGNYFHTLIGSQCSGYTAEGRPA